MAVPTVEVNVWAVLVCALVSMFIESLWYSPVLFGNVWLKLSGFNKRSMKKGQKGMTKIYVLALLGSFVMAYVLAHFVEYTGSRTALDGFILGLWIWLGFEATVRLGTILWEGKPVKLYLLNTIYYLVTLVVMAIILSVWH